MMNTDIRQREWSLCCSSAEGVELRALEFLYAEIGNLIQRDPGRYSLYTIPCRIASGENPAGSAVVFGTLTDNPLLRRFFKPEEIPSDGFRIRIRQNPEHPEKQLILIAGAGPREVLYGAVTFMDDLLPELLPADGDGIQYTGDAFLVPFPELDFADAPATLVRSVFTWAHPIGNYEEYFRNLARLKINRVYLWNEFPPVNAKEAVNFARSCGIEVFWGFSWGWSTNCMQANVLDLKAMSAGILREWHEVWSRLPGDGIYFQSFTETAESSIAGRSIAECVTDLVNYVAEELWKERPSLRIVYGLHASSVRNELDVIDRTDPRMEILWEDCGGFPYKISKALEPMKEHAFTRQVMAMKHPLGLVCKCQLMQKWTDFVHQAGPYILGRNGSAVQAHDVALTSPMWRRYEALWAEHGDLTWDLTHLIQTEGGKNVELNLASQLNGPIRVPTALAAELFWNSTPGYAEIRRRVMRRLWLQR